MGECALRRASLQMGYLKKSGDGNLLYSVVNTAEPDADGGWPVSGLSVLFSLDAVLLTSISI